MASAAEPANAARPVRLLPFVASAAAVLVVALAAEVLTRFVWLPHVTVLFLAPVVMSAALWGLWPAVLAALLGAAAGSFFFYSPIFDFRVAAPQDIADLAVFLIVAVFTSRLAANVRTQAFEARRRQQRLSALLEFTNRLSGAGSDANLRELVVDGLAPFIGSPIYLLEPAADGLAVTAARPAGEPLPAKVRAAAERAVAGAADEPPGWRIARLDAPQGAVAVVAARTPARAPDADYAAALLSHAALALEGERLRRAIGEARLKMQGEALREALLSSISHDLHTPLAGILGSVTALQTIGDQGSPATHSELLATIRDEAERLTAHIENVLDLTRIRAGQVAVRLELVELADIVNAALRRKHRQLRDHAVELRLPPDLPMLRLDLFLMEHALGAVLDNAAKYAPPGSTVVVSAVHENDRVVLDVSDAGSGIATDELPRVFDAFFRGTAPGRRAAGTGLGLAICRAFVEANGGTVEIGSSGTGRGTTVRFILPVPTDEALAEEAVSDE
jgi:two-component system, OmpR family, sensor histidine kinase KdpD